VGKKNRRLKTHPLFQLTKNSRKETRQTKNNLQAGRSLWLLVYGWAMFGGYDEKNLLIIALTCFLAFAGMFAYGSDIFQRGNPVPYITKMLILNDSNHYQKVLPDKEIYITKRYDFDGLRKYIENTYDVKFDAQLGGGYSFTSDKAHILVISTIYWRYYLVWELTRL